MLISEVYSKYKIPEHLQLHQLRVAAVSWQICGSLNLEIDKTTIVKTCLVHDMANVLKFKLDKNPIHLENFNIEEMRQLQQEFLAKYGPDIYAANEIILKEIGIFEELKAYLDWIGARNLKTKDIMNTTKEDIPFLIAPYSDTRVSPYGIISIQKRLSEVAERSKEVHEQIEQARTNMEYIENLIFQYSKIKPGEITDKSSAKVIEDLKNFKIK